MPPELSLARARAFQTLGNFERARADLETALESSRKLGQQQLEWEALIDRGLLEAGRDYHRAGGFLFPGFPSLPLPALELRRSQQLPHGAAPTDLLPSSTAP